MDNIYGLTLTRPWPFAFVSGPIQYQKRIENRSWAVPTSLRFQGPCYIALHAGKGWDELDREFIARTLDMHVPPKTEHPDSQIFAVCRVRLCVSEGDHRIREEQRRWAFGPFCWIIEDFVQLIEPVPCSGAQKLWSFDKKPGELQELRRIYRATLSQQQGLAANY